jgi:hypothetical protein
LKDSSEPSGRHTASHKKNIQRRKMQKTETAQLLFMSEMTLVDIMDAVYVDISIDH